MRRDLENLSNELVQAQLLLCAHQDEMAKMLLEISRRKIQDGAIVASEKTYPVNMGQPGSSERDLEIKRMLDRLAKLG